MTLQGYLARLADTLHSRHDITLEELRLMLTTVGAIFQANARFYDGSRLLIVEEVERVSSRDVRRVAYKFHYQQTDGTLVFRYDDSLTTRTCPLFLITSTRVIPLLRQPCLTWPMFCARLMH